MKQKISLCELVKILDNYSRTNDFVRVVSLGATRYNGEPYHGVWVEKTNGTEELIKIPYFEKKEIVLTKEEAIKRHRMMWNWIAYETLKRKERVTKREAIEHFGWLESEMLNECWCCSYARKDGTCEDNCPVQWPGDACYGDLSRGIFGLYIDWVSTDFPTDYKRAAALAHKIANLPEKN